MTQTAPVTEPTVVLTDRYTQAIAYAAAIHETQVRKGTNLPYMSHLLAVSASVLEAGGTEDQAIAALLHDAAEDQGGEGRLAGIRVRFGADVAAIVEGCSDSLAEDHAQKRPWRERKEEHLKHLRAAPPSVIIVAAADKLHNARAIATDLRLDPSVMDRFNASADQQLWYYQQVLAVLQEQGAPAALTTPLADSIGIITQLTDAGTNRLGALD